MICLPDHHTAVRIAMLRQMQGLPFAIPPGHTAYRQSDFENSKLWRYVFIAALAVGIARFFEAPPAPVAPTVVHSHASVAGTV